MKKRKNNQLSELAKYAAEIKINKRLNKYDNAEPSPCVKKKMKKGAKILALHKLPE